VVHLEHRLVLHKEAHKILHREILRHDCSAKRSRPIGLQLGDRGHKLFLAGGLLRRAFLFTVADVLRLLEFPAIGQNLRDSSEDLELVLQQSVVALGIVRLDRDLNTVAGCQVRLLKHDCIGRGGHFITEVPSNLVVLGKVLRRKLSVVSLPVDGQITICALHNLVIEVQFCLEQVLNL